MKIAVSSVLVVCALMVAAPPASAQDGTSWYAGVSAGRLDTDYRPYYTYFGGGTPDQFHNEANGFEIEVFVGRTHRLSRRWSLGVQGSAAFNGFDWSLDIPEEPASLTYSLPYRIAASIVPELHLGRVSVFADAGTGVGRVHLLKTSPTSSAYDYDKRRAILSAGGGIRVRVSTAWTAQARVGHVRYARTEFDSHDATGARIEHVTDKPRATGFTVGVIRRF